MHVLVEVRIALAPHGEALYGWTGRQRRGIVGVLVEVRSGMSPSWKRLSGFAGRQG